MKYYYYYYYMRDGYIYEKAESPPSGVHRKAVDLIIIMRCYYNIINYRMLSFRGPIFYRCSIKCLFRKLKPI